MLTLNLKQSLRTNITLLSRLLNSSQLRSTFNKKKDKTKERFIKKLVYNKRFQTIKTVINKKKEYSTMKIQRLNQYKEIVNESLKDLTESIFIKEREITISQKIIVSQK